VRNQTNEWEVVRRYKEVWDLHWHLLLLWKNCGRKVETFIPFPPRTWPFKAKYIDHCKRRHAFEYYFRTLLHDPQFSSIFAGDIQLLKFFSHQNSAQSLNRYFISLTTLEARNLNLTQTGCSF